MNELLFICFRSRNGLWTYHILLMGFVSVRSDFADGFYISRLPPRSITAECFHTNASNTHMHHNELLCWMHLLQQWSQINQDCTSDMGLFIFLSFSPIELMYVCCSGVGIGLLTYYENWASRKEKKRKKDLICRQAIRQQRLFPFILFVAIATKISRAAGVMGTRKFLIYLFIPHRIKGSRGARKQAVLLWNIIQRATDSLTPRLWAP